MKGLCYITEHPEVYCICISVLHALILICILQLEDNSELLHYCAFSKQYLKPEKQGDVGAICSGIEQVGFSIE